jgi:phospholipase D1/2
MIRSIVKSFEDYDTFLPKEIKHGHLYDPNRTDVKEKLDQIRGHLVWMPLDFLKDSEMAEKGLQVNTITESIYT